MYSFLICPILLTMQLNLVNSVILNRGWLEYWYPNFKTAQKIDLSQYDIDTVDPNTFVDLINLNELYLSSNQIRKIDDASTFSNLLNLKIVNINNNQLVSLNQSIFYGLENLESVFLVNNPICETDPNFVRSLCSKNPKCTIYI